MEGVAWVQFVGFITITFKRAQEQIFQNLMYASDCVIFAK